EFAVALAMLARLEVGGKCPAAFFDDARQVARKRLDIDGADFHRLLGRSSHQRFLKFPMGCPWRDDLKWTVIAGSSLKHICRKTGPDPDQVRSGLSFRLICSCDQALTADMARSIRQCKATFQPFRRSNARKRGSLRLIRSSRLAVHLPFGRSLFRPY